MSCKNYEENGYGFNSILYDLCNSCLFHVLGEVG